MKFPDQHYRLTASYGQEIHSDPIAATNIPERPIRIGQEIHSDPVCTVTLPALQGDPAAIANGLKREAGDAAHITCQAIPALPPQR